jgi:hypothetical protein
MINFCKHIFVVLLILSISAFVLDSVYTAAFHTGFARNKTQYAVQLNNIKIDYIFLGSSRTENHIDCELITKLTGKSCLNLGLKGSKANDSAALLQILKDNDVTYEKVFFQLDYAVNFDAFSPTFLSSIMPFIGDDKIKSNLSSKLEMPSLFQLPFVKYAANDKLVGLREVILQLYRKPGRLDLDNGFEGLTGNGRNIKGNLPKTIDKNNRSIHWMQELEPEKLIFFTAPYCKGAINRDVMIQDLKNKYPNVICYIKIFDNQEINFIDCGHLNIKGAQSFTRILTNDLLLN